MKEGNTLHTSLDTIRGGNNRKTEISDKQAVATNIKRHTTFVVRVDIFQGLFKKSTPKVIAY